MERENPLGSLLDVSMQNLRALVDADTIIGKPIVNGAVTIIPVSKATFGFGAGGSEFAAEKPRPPFGGGSGAGVSIEPIAFLVINGEDVRLLQITTANSTADRIVNMVPAAIDGISGAVEKFMPGKGAKEAAAPPVNP